LEGTREVGPRHPIKNQGIVVAYLYELGRQVGSVATTDSKCLHISAPTGLMVQVYAARWMCWSHAGAMRLLHGVHPRDILGPEWLLIRGSHRVTGHPSPGVDAPVLAKVLQNPSDLPPEEVFKVVWQAIA
jgi:hypothetical protein